MSEIINNRKLEHIKVIESDPDVERSGHCFDSIDLLHRALPEIALDAVDTTTEFLGKKISFPMLISSMTGGDHSLLKKINYNLAQAAQLTSVAMAVGSQRVMLDKPAAKSSFELRDLAPDIPLISNIGAVQLNYGIALAEVEAIIACLQADGIYLHLNPLQEAVQPEGDTNFSNLADKIKELTTKIDCPILLKEVGSGLSPKDIEIGLKLGVKIFDLSGRGGTSWSRIEHRRCHGNNNIGMLFQDWGISTPTALKLAEPYLDRATIIASGGIRDGIDMVKSVILGASVCGMAAPLLKPAMESVEAVVTEIERIKLEFKTAMFLLGIPNIVALHNNRALIIDES